MNLWVACPLELKTSKTKLTLADLFINTLAFVWILNGEIVNLQHMSIQLL